MRFMITIANRLYYTHSDQRGCTILHWIPIKERVNFKIAVLTYKTLNELQVYRRICRKCWCLLQSIRLYVETGQPIAMT